MGVRNLQVEWFPVMTRPRVCPQESWYPEEERKKKPLDVWGQGFKLLGRWMG